MLVLFQEGIPDIFFPALKERGVRIARFPTDGAAAEKIFRENPEAGAVFFRANFTLGEKELDLLPHLALVALVSTGADNLDAAAVHARNIRLVTGEGTNARAVFDYVIQALLFGAADFSKQNVGIVGVGNVGGRLKRFLDAVGVQNYHYDPFLADAGSLEKVLQCDYVSFHVPLNKTGAHKTAGMLNAGYFRPVTKKIRIIQACRGGIWDPAFYESLASHSHLELLAQDVYPHEPPPAEFLSRAQFSTPHIAGYSALGRLGGILKGIKALFPDFSSKGMLPESRSWFLDEEAAAFAANPANFQQMRDRYFWRKEFHEYNATEREAFRRRFPQVSESFMETLFSIAN